MDLTAFASYLKNEKKMSQNTQEAYTRDINGFNQFLLEKGSLNINQVANTDVVSYLLTLKKSGKSAATINRKLASLRVYYNYLIDRGQIDQNPTTNIKSPKVARKELEYLTIEEIDSLLATPNTNSLLGRRDKAILELLYATGIRVNELLCATLDDVNLRIGFFTCTGDSGKARIIPIGRPARAALDEYIYSGRDRLIKTNKEEKSLFVNYHGQKLTRQGLWKILREYGKKANLEPSITPHILRSSFAVHMIQNGADLKSLQELLGHEDLSATQIYLNLTKNRIKDVYDKSHPRA